MLWDCIFRLLLAGVLGGVIGWDREYRAKEAGLRTHFLVALGSALIMIVFTIGSLIMTIFTEDIITACSAVVSSMSNVGPGFGSVGPMFSYAHLNDFAKLFLAFLMLVGRLEIFTVMVLFTKAFWRK